MQCNFVQNVDIKASVWTFGDLRETSLKKKGNHDLVNRKIKQKNRSKTENGCGEGRER